jgi:hypothetical protein
MPIEIGLWRVGETLQPMAPAKFDVEARLEKLIAENPAVLGMDLLIVGQQENAFGKRIDLLAIDAEGRLAIIELKRDKTPRDVVAQVLEYGAWAATLDLRQVEEMYATGRTDKNELSQAFSERFGAPLPDTFSGEAHRLIIVCSELDASTERIVAYLSTRGVPINVVFFRSFRDAGGEFLARTWFIERKEAEVRASRSSKLGEPWNGIDYYVAFGLDRQRDWEDARRYGFISAGQGSWYSRTLNVLEPGARVFACIPGTGYVGVGTVTDAAKPVRAFDVEVDGVRRPILDAPLRAPAMAENADDPEKSEYVVRVEWIRTVPVTAAVWEKGMFANQNSACRLRNRFTLDVLYRQFGLADANSEGASEG